MATVHLFRSFHRGILMKFLVAIMLCLGGQWSLAAISPAEAIANVTVPKNAPAKQWGDMTTRQKAQFVCAMSGGLALLVSEIWFIVAGFQVSVGWGLYMLFFGGLRSLLSVIAVVGWMYHLGKLTHLEEFWRTPEIVASAYALFTAIFGILFVTRHWKEARPPLKVALLGIFLFAVVVVLEFAS